MKYSLEKRTPEQQQSDCIILPLFEDLQLSQEASYIDQASNQQLSKLFARKDFDAKTGSTLLLSGDGTAHTRVLLVGLGKQDAFTPATLKKSMLAATEAVKKTQTQSATISFDGITLKDYQQQGLVRFTIEAISDSLYIFDDFKTTKADKAALNSVAFYCGNEADTAVAEQAIAEGSAIAAGVTVAKTLGNLPGNICTPTYLATKAEEIAKDNNSVTTTILDETKMAALGMHSLLSVSAGSEEPAHLIIMEYKGADADEQAHVLVGKGITFDSGGISLKPGEAMDEMKYDMCGAASVFGTMTAITELQPKINITAIIAAAENMPSGKATKPGDIVSTMSGQTVEILNTDAEGRLVLCDAITYAEQNHNPASIVDIATLTGACIIALGHHTTGLLGNDDDLANELLAAGTKAADKAWRLPIGDEYQAQLDSNFADMQNIGGRPAGTITAACFLSRFAKNMKWAHLDIAGTAWVSGKSKGATGRPVPMLTQYILNKLN
ncbi:leucyl aminopeptidase [Alkalimarinus sediminis]|uniref:Probable cytosol aminopeptidase n=1 Tax=Alkalimarinus sediminis TaxID=1632866 RepID=A0A9E8HIE5_9ALTE|nr:leucyl aminopeptidase [Alkalimarinus sediminis]UZW73276.1 leucyl aminopeptidase [Alkalimarinus sediminis]